MQKFKTTKVATASINTTALDISGNINLIKQCITQAANESVDLLVFPELSISGYGCEDLFFAPGFIQSCQQALIALLDDIPDSGLVISIGLPYYDQESAKLYNASALIAHKQMLAIVCKQYLAKTGIHYEPRWFNAWPAGTAKYVQLDEHRVLVGDVLIDINGVRIGLEICEDAWVENRPGKQHTQAGVDIIINPSASHFSIAKHQQRYQLVQQGAIAFDCLYIYCNLLGCEAGRTIYDGGILIANQEQLLLQGQRFSFQPYTVEIVTAQCKVHHHPKVDNNIDIEVPGFADKDTLALTVAQTFKAEDELSVVLMALALGLWDWQRKTSQKGYVISLSGGADSALCASAVYLAHALALKQLGVDQYLKALSKLGLSFERSLFSGELVDDLQKIIMPNVLTTVYQKSANSGGITEKAAKGLAKEIGSAHHQWDISAEITAYQDKVQLALGRKLNWQNDDIALQNIQARVRSPGIWMVANVEQKLLLATSNLSEASVGYCTMDGDTSGVLAPIGGVSKSLVLKLIAYLCGTGLDSGDKLFQLPSLSAIVNQKPTAELRPIEQADEQDLMPYEVLDTIRRHAQIDHDMPESLVKKLSQLQFSKQYSEQQLHQYVEKYFTLYSRNQWKRERLAVSFHIEQDSACPKTYRRYPVINHLSHYKNN